MGDCVALIQGNGLAVRGLGVVEPTQKGQGVAAPDVGICVAGVSPQRPPEGLLGFLGGTGASAASRAGQKSYLGGGF